MEKEKQRPKVGVGVMIFKDGKVLLGKRKNAHGAGEYAWPGGHLEFMESFEDCAKREVAEEAGIKIKNVRFVRLMNFKGYDKHYADIGLSAEWESGEPKVMEPEKCEGWDWYDLDDLPSPLFYPIPSYVEAIKTGKIFFDK
jgi:8-oxo-dGTP diphosphatase